MISARVLLTGLQFPECPRWHDGRLWVADWRAREVIALTPAGERETALRVPSSPCSFDWAPDGSLLVVSGGDAALLRERADGSLAPHADLAPVTSHPWNEIVVDGRGHAYVNSVGFDFPGQPPAGDTAPGVVALVTPEGAVRQVADVPNRRCVRVREGGATLDRIELDRGAFACMLGGRDGRTLFIAANEWRGPERMGEPAARGQVLAAEVAAAGAGWPSGRAAPRRLTGSNRQETSSCNFPRSHDPSAPRSAR